MWKSSPSRLESSWHGRNTNPEKLVPIKYPPNRADALFWIIVTLVMILFFIFIAATFVFLLTPTCSLSPYHAELNRLPGEWSPP